MHLNLTAQILTSTDCRRVLHAPVPGVDTGQRRGSCLGAQPEDCGCCPHPHCHRTLFPSGETPQHLKKLASDCTHPHCNGHSSCSTNASQHATCTGCRSPQPECKFRAWLPGCASFVVVQAGTYIPHCHLGLPISIRAGPSLCVKRNADESRATYPGNQRLPDK